MKHPVKSYYSGCTAYNIHRYKIQPSYSGHLTLFPDFMICKKAGYKIQKPLIVAT